MVLQAQGSPRIWRVGQNRRQRQRTLRELDAMLSETIQGLTTRVDTELANIIGSHDMPLYDMMHHHMGWANSADAPRQVSSRDRLHGVLCLLSCQAAGGDIEEALPGAAALELVHKFTQIHADVETGNPKRDNRDAVWWVWGPAQAINAGDGMHALARLALFQLSEGDVSLDTTFKAIQLLDEAGLETCEGRFLELEAQEMLSLSVEKYLSIVAGKTGALVACAMKLGALIARKDDVTLQPFGDYGRQLGIAMQIRSDLDALWGENRSDAEPNADVMNKTKLLPIIYALESASATQKRRIGEIYMKRVLEPSDVEKLKQVLDEGGARERTQQLADEYYNQALSSLEAADIEDSGRTELARFSSWLINATA